MDKPANPTETPRAIAADAIGLAAIISILFGLWLWNSRDEAIEGALSRTKALTHTIAVLTEQMLEKLDQPLLFVQARYRHGARHGDLSEIDSILAAHKKATPYIAHIVIFDSDGRLVRSPAQSRLPDLPPPRHFPTLRDDPQAGRLLTSVFKSFFDRDRWRFALSRRLEDENGNFVGVVSASVDVEALSRVYDGLRDHPAMSVTLMYLDGTVVGRSPFLPDTIGQGLASFARYGGNPPAEIAFVNTSLIDNVRRVIAQRRFDGFPMLLAVTLTEEAALAGWRGRLPIVAGIWAIIVATIAGAGLVAHRRRIETRLRERALAESEDRLRLVIKGTNDGIWDWNMETNEDYLSPRWKEILGYRDDELPNVASSFFDLLHPDDKEKVKAAIDRHIETGDPYRIELRLRHKNGVYRWILSRGECVRDAAGKAIRMVGAITDISEQKAWEEKVRELTLTLEHRAEERTRELALERERFQISQTFANIGTWDWNIVTGALHWSERIGPLFGYMDGKIETTYDNFLAAIHPDDRHRVIDAVNACVQMGSEYNIEHRIVRADGQVRWLSEKGDVIRSAAGQPIRMLGVVQDITDRKITEEHLRHAQKLESLGNLAGGVAHSLNNLLVPILALSKMTADGLPKDSTARAALDKVIEASARARDLVARILAFSRREAPCKAAADLRAIVEDALRLARTSVPAAIRLEADLAPRPVPVMADGPQIEAVVLNLITNAVAAIDDGNGNGGGQHRPDGCIVVRLAVSDAGRRGGRGTDRRGGGSHAVLSVEDNGCGMDAAIRERIFDPFFTTKKVGDGTGLGLSVAHGIVEEHGGSIEVESEPGRGAIFRVHLPLLASDAAALQKAT